MKRFVLFFSMVFCLGLSTSALPTYAKADTTTKITDSAELKESEKEELRKIVREEMAKEKQTKEEQKATPAVQVTKKPVKKTNTEVTKTKQKQKKEKETHQWTLFEAFGCSFIIGLLVVGAAFAFAEVKSL